MGRQCAILLATAADEETGAAAALAAVHSTGGGGECRLEPAGGGQRSAVWVARRCRRWTCRRRPTGTSNGSGVRMPRSSLAAAARLQTFTGGRRLWTAIRSSCSTASQV